MALEFLDRLLPSSEYLSMGQLGTRQCAGQTTALLQTTITCGSHVVDPWLCWGQATGFACANFEPHPTSGVLTLASVFLRFLSSSPGKD